MRVRLSGLPCPAVAAVLLAVAITPVTAPADEPMVVIHQQGRQSVNHMVSDVIRIEFDGDTADVVLTDATERYDLEGISRIDFAFGLAGIWNPPGSLPTSDVAHLLQNLPNPFSPETRITYRIPVAGHVRLTIHDIGGRLIRTLVDRECGGGEQIARWDGRDDGGRSVPGGIYFYRLVTREVEESKQMILLR